MRDVKFTGFDAFGLTLVGWGVPITLYTFPWWGIGTIEGHGVLWVFHVIGLIAGVGVFAFGRRSRRRAAQ